MTKKLNKEEKKELAFHLTIIGIFLLFTFSSCSTAYLLINRDRSDIIRTQRYDITEKDLTQFASSLRPRRQDVDLLYRQACYFQRLNKHKLALQVLEELILNDLANVKAYNALGISYDGVGDYPRAIEAYKWALKLNPNLAYVQNNLGYSYFLQGNHDAAIDAFKRAIELDGDNGKYHNNLALVYAQKGLYAMALAEFEMSGDEAKAHYNIAKIYHQRGRDKEAEIHFAEAAKLNPEADESSKGLPQSGTLGETGRTAALGKEKETWQKSSYYTEIDDKGRKKVRFKINTENSTPPPVVDSSKASSILTASSQFKAHDSEEEKNLIYYEVEVSNGNGVRRMARRVGDYLRNKGLNVTRLTNAKDFNVAETKIYYHGDFLPNAFDVAKNIPGYQQMQVAEKFGRPAIKIKLVIGKDIVPYDELFRKNNRES